MRISDWSSDVCSSDLPARHAGIDALFQYSLAKVGAHLPRRDGDVDRRFRRQPEAAQPAPRHRPQVGLAQRVFLQHRAAGGVDLVQRIRDRHVMDPRRGEQAPVVVGQAERSEEHTSELQSLMRISYAVFYLKKKTYIIHT